MQRSTLIFLVVLAIFAGLLGYNYFAQPFADLANQEEPLIASPSPEPQLNPLDQLTPAELVGQLIAYPLLVDDLVAELESDGSSAQLTWIEQNHPSSVLLFGDNLSSTSAELVELQLNQLETDTNSSFWLMVDHEGGAVQRLSGPGFTRLPSWREMCQLEVETQNEILTDSAQELAAVGIDVVLAPVVDLASSSGQLENRACSADPTQVVARTENYLESFKAAGIMPVLKHFPGIGSVSVDLHLQFANVNLKAADLQVFEQLLNQDRSLGVMVTHVGVVEQYPDQPCSLNQDCVTDLSQYFSGVLVIADALDMMAASDFPALDNSTTREILSNQGSLIENNSASESTAAAEINSLSLAERAVAAVKAGNDLLTFGRQVRNSEMDEVVQALISEYQKQPEFAQQVKASVEKIWQYQELYQN